MPQDRQLTFNTLALYFGKTLSGSHGGASQPAEDISRYLRMIQAGKFDSKGFVSQRLPFEEIKFWIKKMCEGEAVHCIVHFS